MVSKMRVFVRILHQFLHPIMTTGDLINIDQSTDIIYSKSVPVLLKRSAQTALTSISDKGWGKPADKPAWGKPSEKSDYQEKHSNINIQVSSTSKQTGRFKVF